jgi:hypothetical protein
MLKNAKDFSPLLAKRKYLLRDLKALKTLKGSARRTSLPRNLQDLFTHSWHKFLKSLKDAKNTCPYRLFIRC